MAILDAADEEFRIMLLFAASTGVRAGDQWALRWKDIDFDAGELRVMRRVDRYRADGPPKTAAGICSIPLSTMLINTLREWKLKTRFKETEDLLFRNEQGRHVPHDNLAKRRFKPTLQKAGAVGTTWHSLCHSAISTWIEAGLMPKTVQTFAGHSSIQVTMDRYGHLFPSEDHKVAMDNIAKELIG